MGVTEVLSFALDRAADMGTIRLLMIYKSSGMIVGPCVGYIFQMRRMVVDKNAEGFSTFVSFILLVANLIRVFWW